jgi:hypothetical protein
MFKMKYIFPQILVTFKIKNLTISNCVKDWGKVSPRQGWCKEAPGRVRVRDAKFVRVYLSSNYKECHCV